MNLGGAAARGAFLTVGGQWVRFAIQVVGIIVLARLITPEDYGLFAMTVALTGAASLLGDFGLSMAAIQAQDITVRQRSNLLWINVGLGGIIAGSVWLLSWPIAGFYGQAELVPVVQALSITFLLNASSAQFRSEVSRKLKFGWLAGADVGAQAVALPIAIAVAATGGGYWALVAQQIALASVPLAVLVIGARWLPVLPSRAPMADFLKFGGNTTATQILAYVSANVDSVLLGRVWGAESVGVYNRAYQLLLLPLQQIASPMTRVAVPILSRLQGASQYQRYIERGQVVLVYSLGLIFLTAVVTTNPLIDIVLGPAWTDSKLLFQILAIGGIFQALSYLYYWIFLSKAMTGLQLRYSLVSRSIMIVLIAAGLPWGAVGVAVGASVGLAVNWAILTFGAIPRTGVSVAGLLRASSGPISLYVIIAIGLVPLGWHIATWENPWLELLLLLAVETAVLGMAWLVFPRIRRDAGVLLQTFKLIRAQR